CLRSRRSASGRCMPLSAPPKESHLLRSLRWSGHPHATPFTAAFRA
ncbi:MAG: hypothetical protein AVDCRST_MAG62-1434, partial [uncultured Sphingomonas sp.]